jgi:hypothetical protein
MTPVNADNPEYFRAMESYARELTDNGFSRGDLKTLMDDLTNYMNSTGYGSLTETDVFRLGGLLGELYPLLPKATEHELSDGQLAAIK